MKQIYINNKIFWEYINSMYKLTTYAHTGWYPRHFEFDFNNFRYDK